MEVQADTKTAVSRANKSLVVVIIFRGLRIQIFQCETSQNGCRIVALGSHWQRAVPFQRDVRAPMPVLGIAWPEKSLTLFLFISRLASSSFVRQLSGMQRTFSVRVKVVKRPSFYLDIFFSQRWQSSALRKFFSDRQSCVNRFLIMLPNKMGCSVVAQACMRRVALLARASNRGLGGPSPRCTIPVRFARPFLSPVSFSRSLSTRYAQPQEKNTRAFATRGLLPFGRFTGPWYRRFRDSIHPKGCEPDAVAPEV